MGNFDEESDFFVGWWKSVQEWFWPFKPFSKLKTPFCKYWTSIKPKLAWPVWNYDENGTGATTPAKNEVFVGL